MFRPLFIIAVLLTGARAGESLDDALALARAHRPLEARAALEQVVVAEPGNAAAWHALGMLWKQSQDPAAYERAVESLKHASDLEPRNAEYLGDYGGTSLELADRTRSIGAATRGREALEQAVALDPGDLDAREGLFQFYRQAPFFVGGSAAKAAEQLAAIRARDPNRALTLSIVTLADAKDYHGAFAACEAVLAREPDNYLALYYYGRTAALSGQNLERGRACLRRTLELKPPSPAAPKATRAWFRLGQIERKLGRVADARAALRKAVELDPGNQQAARALQELK